MPNTIEIIISQFVAQIEDQEDFTCNVSSYIDDAIIYISVHASSLNVDSYTVECLLEEEAEGFDFDDE